MSLDGYIDERKVEPGVELIAWKSNDCLHSTLFVSLDRYSLMVEMHTILLRSMSSAFDRGLDMGLSITAISLALALPLHHLAFNP